MAIGGLIVAALLLRAWYVLLLPVLLLILLTLIIAPAVAMKLARALRLAGRRHIIPLRDRPLFPGASGGPQTPLPAASLVRVLETYDLSTSAVQQFVAAVPERDTAELRLDLWGESSLGFGPDLEDNGEDGDRVTDTQLL